MQQISQDRHFTVSQINQFIKYTLDASPVLSDIYIHREISNFTNHYRTGHLYFSVKDEASVLRTVMFKSAAAHLKFLPENGMKVLIHGRISSYVRDGQYQLYADTMEPDGIGALAVAFEQLKRKLEAEGLFDPGRKKKLPKFPKAIGIVTSPTGAAIRDILQILGRRYPIAKVILFPVQVQGEAAPRQLISGIQYFNRHPSVDLIIIGRGGGSMEELWAFNNESLARTIAASTIPVVSAVGHEIDFTISDFAADLRAPTPSAAAELSVPDAQMLRQQLWAADTALSQSVRHQLDIAWQKLNTLKQKRVLKSPDVYLSDKHMQIVSLTERLFRTSDLFMLNKRSTLSSTETRFSHSTERRVSAMRALLSQRSAQLAAMNPLSVLSRGYSVVYLADGTTMLRHLEQLSEGDRFYVQTAEGKISGSVTKLEPSALLQEKCTNDTP